MGRDAGDVRSSPASRRERGKSGATAIVSNRPDRMKTQGAKEKCCGATLRCRTAEACPYVPLLIASVAERTDASGPTWFGRQSYAQTDDGSEPSKAGYSETCI